MGVKASLVFDNRRSSGAAADKERRAAPPGTGCSIPKPHLGKQIQSRIPNLVACQGTAAPIMAFSATRAASLQSRGWQRDAGMMLG